MKKECAQKYIDIDFLEAPYSIMGHAERPQAIGQRQTNGVQASGQYHNIHAGQGIKTGH